jgi:4-carboxymuconolactone decarboxylase
MIYSPEMALRANRLAEYLAEQSPLPEKIKRLAALIAARSMDCQYVWNAQAPAGRRAGLSGALIDALREKKPLPAMPADEVAVVHYGLELAATNQVGQETFQAALDQLGAQGLTEFTTSLGYFRMLALNANAFTIDLPEQRTEPLLPV